ncbi:hypothetical protein ACOMHN_046096 [Nucella lapillus]
MTLKTKLKTERTKPLPPSYPRNQSTACLQGSFLCPLLVIYHASTADDDADDDDGAINDCSPSRHCPCLHRGECWEARAGSERSCHEKHALVNRHWPLSPCFRFRGGKGCSGCGSALMKGLIELTLLSRAPAPSLIKGKRLGLPPEATLLPTIMLLQGG